MKMILIKHFPAPIARRLRWFCGTSKPITVANNVARSRSGLIAYISLSFLVSLFSGGSVVAQ